MPPVGFEPTISAGKRPKTYAVDRAATGTGYINWSVGKYEAFPESKDTRALNMYNVFNLQKRQCE